MKKKSASKLSLKKNPTLKDFQRYLVAMSKERGFDKVETIPGLFMMLMEECGELAKAARRARKMGVDEHSEVFEVEQEAADVFIFLLKICNHLDIDLEQAFRVKEEKNKKRVWK